MNRLVIAIIAVCINSAYTNGQIETRGRLESVTVYRGQALVVRQVELAGPAGLTEVVVTDLPEHIIPSSLYADSRNGVEVRSVQYRVRPVREDVREEVRELDEAIKELQRKLAANKAERALIERQRAYLDKLELFVAPTAQVEMTKGVLNAQTIEKITAFTFETRQELSERDLQLSFEQSEITSEVDLLQRQRQGIAGRSAKTVREAIVFLDVQDEAGAVLNLNYLVSNASWSPSYAVRSENDTATVEYQASVHQMSGEDWQDVKMTLSTATPSLAARAPKLSPLKIALGSGQMGQIAAGNAGFSYDESRDKLAQQLRGLEQLRNIAISKGGFRADDERESAGRKMRYDADLNVLAEKIQIMDLIAPERIRRSTVQPAPVSEEGPSVTYALRGRTSLPSRNDWQLIRIASSDLGGDFYKVAIPVLTNYIYDEARLVNSSGQVYLGGPVSTYVRGQFVGRSDIPTVAEGESFTIGLGVDSSLTSSRQLVEKTSSISGGNRIVELTYQIKIENFSADPQLVRVMDRLPRPADRQIELTLVSSSTEPTGGTQSGDGPEKTGVMQWELNVPGHSVGADAATIEYTFRLEYDKQMSLIGSGLEN